MLRPPCADEYQVGIEQLRMMRCRLAKRSSRESHGHDRPFVRVFQTDDEFEFDIVKSLRRAHGISLVTTGDPTAEFGMTFTKRMPTFDELAVNSLTSRRSTLIRQKKCWLMLPRVGKPPNPRLQRTRMGAPLSRNPFGPIPEACS